MLVIRLQRTGRTNLAHYRLIVQDKRNHPKRGKVVAYVGTYNPYTKAVSLDKDKLSLFLQNGAQPTNTVARLCKSNGVKLPSWVSIEKRAKRSTRHPEKLRKNRSAKDVAPEPKKDAGDSDQSQADAAATEDVTLNTAAAV